MTVSRKPTGKKSNRRKKSARATSAATVVSRLAMTTAAPTPIIVDAHVHTFNASDLSKTGFVTEVLLDSDEKLILKLIQPLIKLLVNLLTDAPGFHEEIDHLNSMHASASHHTLTAFAQATAERRAEVDRDHWNNVGVELQRISLSSNGQERALFEAIVDEVTPGGVAALAAGPDALTAQSLAGRIAGSNGAISRYIKWAGRLKHFRADIIEELIETYGREPDGVTLFASALVDFQFWLKDAPETSFPDQIELGSRLTRAFPGRIHFLAPFDPWREVAATAGQPGSLELVKKAVMEDGFIGVKVYPPMGFAPIDNAALDFSKVGVTDPRFGKQLDDALENLYVWAVKEDVPIMAHCNLSQESKHGFALRASPAYWTRVIANHPGMRLNLGHFGGQENLGPSNSTKPPADWPEMIIALLDTPEGSAVHTDVGHFDMQKPAWFAALKKALGSSKNLQSRLMYGSDWMMLATQPRYEEFLELFRKGMSAMKSLTAEQISAILGDNARVFLGLGPGQKGRARLQTFYNKHGIPLPTWLT
jgi:predicted TIM-barrel fold metal-dependent hydrolase